MNTVLMRLKVTRQRLAHFARRCRSRFMEAVASFISLKAFMSDASSAKRNIQFSSSFMMSLINMRNSSGPRMEPWGTPAFIGFVDDSSPAITCGLCHAAPGGTLTPVPHPVKEVGLMPN